MLEAALAGLALGGVYAAILAIATAELRREVTTHLMMVAGGVSVAPPRRAAEKRVPLGAALAVGAVAVAVVLHA